MSGLGDILDALAVKLATDLAAADATTGLSGLLACYGPDVSNTAAVEGYPQATTDGPVGYVMDDGGNIDAGNYEQDIHDIEVRYVYPAADSALAFRVLTPLWYRTKVAMRTDYQLGLRAQGLVRVQVTGRGRIEPDDEHDIRFLVMPVRMQAYELIQTTSYSPE
jgi:hypothetical protein